MFWLVQWSYPESFRIILKHRWKKIQDIPKSNPGLVSENFNLDYIQNQCVLEEFRMKTVTISENQM